MSVHKACFDVHPGMSAGKRNKQTISEQTFYIFIRLACFAKTHIARKKELYTFYTQRRLKEYIRIFVRLLYTYLWRPAALHTCTNFMKNSLTVATLWRTVCFDSFHHLLFLCFMFASHLPLLINLRFAHGTGTLDENQTQT